MKILKLILLFSINNYLDSKNLIFLYSYYYTQSARAILL